MYATVHPFTQATEMRTLVERAIGGDRQALEVLLESHTATAIRIAYGILGNDSDARDAAQGALISIATSIAELKSPDSFTAWFAICVHRTSVNLLKQRRNRQAHEGAVSARSMEEKPMTPVEEQELFATLHEELALLPEKAAAALIQYHVENIPVAEIAASSGQSLEACKKRISRARDELRARLERRGVTATALASMQIMLDKSATGPALPAGFDPAHCAQLVREALAAAGPGGKLNLLPAINKQILRGSREDAPLRLVRAKKISSFRTAAGVVGLIVAVLLLAYTMKRSWRQIHLLETQVADTDPGRMDPPREDSGDNENADSPNLVLSPELNSPKVVAARAALARANNEFGLDLYAQFKAEKGNLFYSPLSIFTALAMTSAGARGNTLAQMEKTLRTPLGTEQHAACGSYLTLLNAESKNGKPRGYKLSVANRLFGQKDFGFKEPFLNLTRTSYGAGLQELDFAGSVETSRQTINTWIEQQTQKKISNAIPPDGLPERTKLVLVNAIYFKGSWDNPFQKQVTVPKPFHLENGESVNVPTMHQLRDFKYTEIENLCQCVELPYRGKALSMVVFLPLKDLAPLEQLFTIENVQAWLKLLDGNSERVELALPKFNVTYSTDLGAPLNALGMTDAFSDAADLSGMAPKGLYISSALHKAFVDVNEDGTEAAAATVFGAEPSSVPPPPKVFNVDRPFIFIIREHATGGILFVGRIVDPSR